MMFCGSFFRSWMSQHVHAIYGNCLCLFVIWYAKIVQCFSEFGNIYYCLLILDWSFLALHVQQICWLTRSFEQWGSNAHRIHRIRSAQAQGRPCVAWPQKWLESGISSVSGWVPRLPWIHRGQSFYNGLSSPIGHKTKHWKGYSNIHWKAIKRHKTTGQQAMKKVFCHFFGCNVESAELLGYIGKKAEVPPSVASICGFVVRRGANHPNLANSRQQIRVKSKAYYQSKLNQIDTTWYNNSPCWLILFILAWGLFGGRCVELGDQQLNHAGLIPRKVSSSQSCVEISTGSSNSWEPKHRSFTEWQGKSESLTSHCQLLENFQPVYACSIYKQDIRYHKYRCIHLIIILLYHFCAFDIPYIWYYTVGYRRYIYI